MSVSDEQDVNAVAQRVAERATALAEREAADLAEALGATNDLALPLLKFHLQAEHLLERILEEHFPRPDRVMEHARLTFAQKLALVHGFDVVAEAGVQALRQVNALRNRCSHVRSTAISADDVHRIGRCLGPEYRSIRRAHEGDLQRLLIFTLAAVAKPLIAAVLLPEITPALEELGKSIGSRMSTEARAALQRDAPDEGAHTDGRPRR